MANGDKRGIASFHSDDFTSIDGGARFCSRLRFLVSPLEVFDGSAIDNRFRERERERNKKQEAAVMESAISTFSLITVSKTLTPYPKPYLSHLHRHLSTLHLNQTPRARFLSWNTRCILNSSLRGSEHLFSPPNLKISHRSACISKSPSCFGSGGGGDGFASGNSGGDGDGGSNGGDTESKSLVGEADEVLASSPDVIILDVGGMSCGGCAASVKRILESLPQVSSASVNLTTETAIVWAVPEAQVSQNWQQQLGEKLASHLTTCGFKSNLRGQGHTIEGDILA